MDPVSQRMMGLRADITPQIARIAATRLSKAPRPLRLSYAGEVLRVRGGQLCPERQMVQVGAELIGAAAATADAEIIVMAVEAIAAIGVARLSVDLTVPRLVPGVFARHALSGEEAAAVRAALDHKDPAAVAVLAGPATGVLTALLAATGPVDEALDRLAAIDLPAEAAGERARVEEIVGLVRAAAPDITLTLDPVEHRGFEYHTGIGFTVFAAGLSGELAGGGRYRARNGGGDEDGERATGVTLYLDTILGTLSPATKTRRILLPVDTAVARAAALRDEGWVTVMALGAVADARAEAVRMRCSHVLAANGPQAVGKGGRS
jgi:ATP phosphoribosyltransferase regulatory subunit